jgi:tRNA-dihydrouridine synthase
MEFYFAPFEGITGYIYRNAYMDIFEEKPEKFFAPFIAVSGQGMTKHREFMDVNPQNNRDLYLVPQLLGNNGAAFVACLRQLEQMGYQEVNLNIGCPYGTVVSKKKGAGLLADKELLRQILDEVFTETSLAVSVKTRVGMESPKEWAQILDIYNEYPLSELIIHPRVREDFYKNKPIMETYAYALKNSRAKVCYNGDIFRVEDYKKLTEDFPDTKCVMLGRGMLCNPLLLSRIKRGGEINKELIKAFHDRLYGNYRQMISGDVNTLFKMKELWNYMQYLFENREKYVKKIRKAQRAAEYESAVRALFAECEIREDAGFEGGN